MNGKFEHIDDNELYKMLGSKNALTREGAFKEIYSRYSKKVYSYILRLTGSKYSADDIYQETFIKLLNSATVEKEMTNLLFYILKIARNMYFRSLNGANKFIPINDLDFEINDDNLENKELTDLLTGTLDLLPIDQKEALILQVYNNMSYQEIAVFMDVPVTSVRNWLIRSKRRIREILEPYFENNTLNRL
jgi:RNA polymerase sigma-70 factor (ECF subfamily)